MIPKMENHDVHHLITGCGTNFEDEIAMQYLLLGNGKLNAHLLAAIFLGTLFLPEYFKMYIHAYQKGKRMKAFFYWDFESLLWQNFEHLQDFIYQNKHLYFIKPSDYEDTSSYITYYFSFVTLFYNENMGLNLGYSGLFVRCLHLSTLHNATKPVYFYTVYYNDTLIRCICMVWRFFVLSGIGKFVDSSFIPE